MEIKINDSVREELSGDEFKYLKLLEFHTDFIDGVKRIRRKLNIPVAEDGETITRIKPIDQKKIRKND